MEGWLAKRGPTVDFKWQQRWCVLAPTELRCYADEACALLRGVIKVGPTTRAVHFCAVGAFGDAEKHKRERPFGFILDVHPQEGASRHLRYFDAGAPEALEAWTAAIERIAQVGGEVSSTQSGAPSLPVDADSESNWSCSSSPGAAVSPPLEPPLDPVKEEPLVAAEEVFAPAADGTKRRQTLFDDTVHIAAIAAKSAPAAVNPKPVNKFREAARQRIKERRSYILEQSLIEEPTQHLEFLVDGEDETGKSKTIGFVIKVAPGGHFRVKSVERGGWAASVGVKPGSSLVAVNGMETAATSTSMFRMLMLSRPILLHLEIPQRSASDTVESREDLPPRMLVADPRLRGVTLGHLLELFEEECGEVILPDDGGRPTCTSKELERKCEEWNQSVASDEALGPNFHALDLLIIKPMTEQSRLSMAEVWKPGGRLARTFVSHSWGADFSKFVQSVLQFSISFVSAELPRLSRQELLHQAYEMSFWISAFSSNRWRHDEEARKPFFDRDFHKVLHADTTRRIVLSLENDGNAFQRVWCWFELGLAMQASKPITFTGPFGVLSEMIYDEDNAVEWVVRTMWKACQVDLRDTKCQRQQDVELILAFIDNFRGVGRASGHSGRKALCMFVSAELCDQAIHCLAVGGFPNAVQEALRCSADANARDQHGIRPLTYAVAHHGRGSDVVKTLLRAGADPLAAIDATSIVNLISPRYSVRREALDALRQRPGVDRIFNAMALDTAELQHVAKALPHKLVVFLRAATDGYFFGPMQPKSGNSGGTTQSSASRLSPEQFLAAQVLLDVAQVYKVTTGQRYERLVEPSSLTDGTCTDIRVQVFPPPLGSQLRNECHEFDAAQSRVGGSRFPDDLLALVAVALPSRLGSLHFNCSAHRLFTDAGLCVFAERLPQTLVALELNFEENVLFSDTGVKALADNLPQHLISLELGFKDNMHITDHGVKSLANSLPPTLQVLVLDFYMNTNFTDACLEELAEHLPEQLKVLSCNFTSSHKFTDRGFACLADHMPQQLAELSLDLDENESVTDEGIHMLASALPNSLTNFRLEMSWNESLTDSSLKALSGCLPRSLKVLELKFDNNLKFTEEGFKPLLRKLPRTLTSVKLGFSMNQNFTDECLNAIPEETKPRLATALDLSADVQQTGDKAACTIC